MKEIKVSVIIPVYNEEVYLRECLDSVLIQTLKDIEVLCIDDGSTDHSLQVLQEYAVKDSRIRIFKQSNQFAGVARNLGMKYAKGQYLSFLDSDDYFESHMLEKMYQTAEAKKADIVICKSMRQNEKTGELYAVDWSFTDSFIEQKELFSGCTLKAAGIFQITKGWAWDKLFRTDFVRACGYEFPDFRSSEDGFFVYMLMARAERMSYLEDTFVTHRTNNKSSLSNTKEKDWINGFRMIQLIKMELEQQGLYEIYCQSFLNEVVTFLKWYLETMHSYEAVKNCYHYMQTVIEPEMRVLGHGREYYFQQKEFDWYHKIIETDFDEYMYQQWKEKKSYAERLEGYLKDQQAALAERSWVFPYHIIEKGKVVILYGAGRIGACYYKQLSDSHFCREIFWVDKDYKKYRDMGLPVQGLEQIKTANYDFVFIAVKKRQIQKEIEKDLLEQGVCLEQIRRYGEQ